MRKWRPLAAITLSAILISTLIACSGGGKESGAGSGAKPEAGAKTEAAGAADGAKTAEGKPDGTSEWPSKTVTLLCGFGAGGSSDLGVRSLASALEKQTGVSFVVQNVTGANGWLCWSQLMDSDPDGYTISLVNTPALFADYLDPQQGRSQTMDDFDFICNHVTDYGLLVAKKGQYDDMAGFMEAAKAEGGVTVGDVGANGNKHIATIELSAENPDCVLTPVHQSGWSDNYAALLGGTLDAVSATYGDVASALSDGELTVLCIFAKERLSALPDVPTCKEAGFGEVISAPSRGYMLPKGVDSATRDKIKQVFETAIADAAHQSDMESLGLVLNYVGGDEYVGFLKEQEQEIIGLKPALGWE